MMIDQPEILVEILSRLPSKSIGLCRCVSKAWNSLLSQPHFIKTHLNRTKQYPIHELSLILVSNFSNDMYSLNLETAHQVFDEMMTPLLPTTLDFADHRFIEATVCDKLSSCDGLIVVEDRYNKLLLANPTTREFKILPELPCVLDHRRCHTIYGIGYDSLADDYKVVTISFYIELGNNDDGEDIMLVNVYSVKNGTWKRVDCSCSYAFAHATGGVYVHGRIHWIVKRTSDYSTVIVAFDLKDDKFRQVPLSSSVDCKDFLFGRVVVLEGCLCMVPALTYHKIDLFVMREYNVKESWTKFTIVVNENLEIRPLCSLAKEQMVLLLGELTVDEKLVMYSVKEGTFKDIVVQGLPEEFGIRRTFVESLLSPHFVYKNEAVKEN